MMIEAIGVLATPEKNPPMPTSTKHAGFSSIDGKNDWILLASCVSRTVGAPKLNDRPAASYFAH